MCRYAFHSYRQHFACFACRKMYKKTPPELARRQLVRERKQYDDALSVCPQCTGRMAQMGLDFKAPPQGDVKAWRIVEHLHARGFNFESCGCGGPGYVPPARLAELPAWFDSEQRKSPGAALLAAIAVRHG